jgi:hypothetical protein
MYKLCWNATDTAVFLHQFLKCKKIYVDFLETYNLQITCYIETTESIQRIESGDMNHLWVKFWKNVDPLCILSYFY